MVRDNVSGKFSFNPGQFWNKTVLFDVSKINKEKNNR